MRIYIKDMPTSCHACHLKMNCDDCEGWECVCVPLHQEIGNLDDLLTDKRRDDCPLIPVPTHGRLIDADKMRESIRRQTGLLKLMGGELSDVAEMLEKGFLQEIDNAPTVIPKEE